MVVGDLAVSVDVVVLGAGPGGYVAAIRAAQLGKEVAIIEAGALGGTCLHEGCIPSKALLHASHQAWQSNHLNHLGIEVGEVKVDFGRMQQWKSGVINTLADGVKKLLTRHEIEIVSGKAWFQHDGEIWVGSNHGMLKYQFEHAIIAVGAEAKALPDLPFDGQRVLTPNQALLLTELPANLTIIGSDYITAELATIFAKLGVTVQLFMAEESLLPDFEPLAGRLVQARLKKLGVKIETKIMDLVAAIAQSELIVVSMGVTPRTANLELQAAGVQCNANGFITVNDRLQTNIPHIYAVGDVTGGQPLAHFAIKQAKVAAESLAGLRVQYAPQAMPRVAWTDPEVATVGLTASEATALGYEVITGRFPLGANGRALTLESANGTIITVAENGTEVLLGVTIIAPHAAEMIGEAALALEMGATLTDLAEIIHPHPSLNEALGESAEVALAKAIHVLLPT